MSAIVSSEAAVCAGSLFCFGHLLLRSRHYNPACCTNDNGRCLFVFLEGSILLILSIGYIDACSLRLRIFS